MRVGIGYDSHRFADGEGKKLILGGVEIPYPRGLVGHSDADAVAREVVASGTPGLAEVVQAFGPDVLDRVIDEVSVSPAASSAVRSR